MRHVNAYSLQQLSLGAMMENGGRSYTLDRSAAAGSTQGDFSMPGLAAAAIWAIGLIVGMSSLATGHLAVALLALVVAVITPWIGLAWVRRGVLRSDDESERPFAGSEYGLTFTAR